MRPERGGALILALMMLSLLTVLGSALLTATRIDVRIGDNYRTEIQLLYLAEAGIEEARELLRVSPATPSQLLASVAGTDVQLSLSRDLDMLLNGVDDSAFSSGTLTDVSGRSAGQYYVFLRNDVADGMTNPNDTNEVLTLLSVAVIEDSSKVLEVTVEKGRFPRLPQGFMLNGTAVDETLDPRLQTVAGMERFVRSIQANATDVYSPAVGTATMLGNVGNSADYRVVVTSGDCVFGPGTGFGILLVRGRLMVRENFRWTGLILVIGQGEMVGSGSYGGVSGAVFIARTRADDRSAENPLGTLLRAPGPPLAELNGQESAFQLNSLAMDAANRVFPYVPIAYREY